MRLKDEKKRIAIYHAAMEVITHHGVESASMSKIAKAAGVSSSTIYVYFKNKSDMINKLYLMVKQEVCSAMLNDLPDDMDIETATKSWMRNYFYYLVDNPPVLSFLEQFYNSPTITDETKQEAMTYFAPLMELHLRAVKERFIKDYPAPLIRAFAVDPVMSLARTHRNRELEMDEALLETALDMAWSAIRN